MTKLFFRRTVSGRRRFPGAGCCSECLLFRFTPAVMHELWVKATFHRIQNGSNTELRGETLCGCQALGALPEPPRPRGAWGDLWPWSRSTTEGQKLAGW